MAPTNNNNASAKPGNNSSKNGVGKLPVSPKSPAYIRESDIGQINGYTLGQKVMEQLGSRDVKCVQKVKNLWRIYITNDTAKLMLTMQGFNLDGKIIKVFPTNPHRTGALRAIAEGADDNIEMIRILIKDLYTSVSDKDILHMLEDVYGVKVATPIRELFWRDPVTKKLSAELLSGDRECFVHPDQLEGKPLPRYAMCGTWSCRLFHKDQFPKSTECFNCFQTDHISSNCKNPKACKVCKEPGHMPGSPECLHYHGPKPLPIKPYGGKKDPLSNHYEHEFKFRHIPGKSVEHHWYYHKAMIHGQTKLAQLCLGASTAAIAKTYGQGIRCAPDWDNSERAKQLMREIQEAKFEEVIPFQEAIHDAHINGTYLVEAVPKNGMSYWSSGLNHEATLHTEPEAWPGLNNMGQILNELAIDRYGSFWEKDTPNKKIIGLPKSGAESESELSDTDGEVTDSDSDGLSGQHDGLTNVDTNVEHDGLTNMDTNDVPPTLDTSTEAEVKDETKSEPPVVPDNVSPSTDATESIIVSPKGQVDGEPQPTVEQGEPDTMTVESRVSKKILPAGASGKKFKKASGRQFRSKTKISTPKGKTQGSPRSQSQRRARSESPSVACKVQIKSTEKDEVKCIKADKTNPADAKIS